MTDIRLTQVSTTEVAGGTSGTPEILQLSTTTVANSFSNPIITQLSITIVAANNRAYTTLNPIIGLGCWTPCGWLMQNRSLLQ
jgi:hypothetical protein